MGRGGAICSGGSDCCFRRNALDVAAIASVVEVEYAEIVSTIASKSAGPGTRQNIDEFTRTTAHGLEVSGGAKRGKAIILLNPAEPPILMRCTIYTRVAEPRDGIADAVESMVRRIQDYVPGYRLRVPVHRQNSSACEIKPLRRRARSRAQVL